MTNATTKHTERLHVQLRLTPEQYLSIHDLADNTGIAMSHLVRAGLLLVSALYDDDSDKARLYLAEAGVKPRQMTATSEKSAFIRKKLKQGAS